jgi:dienelactone hydrolase
MALAYKESRYYVWRAIYGFGYFSFTNQVKYAWPRVQSFFTALRTDSESLKLPVGAAGFCWGGLYAIRLTHSTSVCEIGDSAVGKGSILKPLVDASFMAHPQPLVWPTDAENISRPMSAAIGDRDWCTSVAKIEELERIFQARNDAGVPAEVVMYKGAGHGFAVRYDPGNPNLVTQAQQAQDQAISFFQQHFSQT